MGIYDREYARDSYNDQPGFHLSAPQSITVKIIIFTAIVYLLQKVFQAPSDNPDAFDLTSLLALNSCWFNQPWRAFELLTYGFTHSLYDLRHILFNMLVLWFFGRTVEQRYGSREFIALYLVAIVFSGAVWNLAMLAQYGVAEQGLGVSAVGASGAISAVVLLFAFNYPNATVLLFFVFPIKAWMAGILWVGMDIFGALGRAPGDNVGYECHLGGFLFAVLYFKSGVRLGNYIPTGFKLPSFKRSPSLRVHRPSDNKDAKMENRLDELLGKVSVGGQDSLTSSEKRELNKLSKYFQQKRQ